MTYFRMEVCENGFLLYGEPIFLFLGADCLDEEGGVASEIAHGLKTFEVIVNIFGSESVNFVPIC